MADQVGELESRINKARARVEVCKDRLAAVEEMKDTAVGGDVPTLELRVLEAKERLSELQVDLAVRDAACKSTLFC